MPRIGIRAAFCCVLLGLSVSHTPVYAQTASPNALNFQGRLTTPNGNPVPNGTYSVLFSLYDALTGGTLKYSKTVSNVAVKNGTFAVTLDTFPAGTFDGNLWLEVKIGSDAALTPRTPLVSVPYAMKSSLALTVPDGSISNAKIATGTLTADRFASGVLNSNVWLLNGNSGVTSGFLGTTDNHPLVFKVNGQRVGFTQPASYTYNNNTYFAPNIVNGWEGNSVASGVIGATISGGGGFDFFGNTPPNTIYSFFGTIGGGGGNTIGVSGSSPSSGANFATIGGGYSNKATSITATVSGGQSNVASGTDSSIGGGNSNYASGYSATIAGGRNNSSYGSDASTVGGGYRNAAVNTYATVPGGFYNYAGGVGSFAAGYRAVASYEGSFVWADHHEADFGATAANQFCIRATGGFVFEANDNPIFFTSSTAGEKNRFLSLINSPADSTWTASGLKAGGILCSDNYGFANPGKNEMVVKGGLDIGGYYDHSVYKLVVNGNVYSFGSYSGSDARWKKNIVPLNTALDSILKLRGVSYEWNKAKFPEQNFGDGKQIGFIAQEVEQVLPELVKTDNKGYKAVNYVGVVPVLVEAVKTLNARTVIQQKQNAAEMAALKAENAQLRAELDALAAAVKQLQQERK